MIIRQAKPEDAQALKILYFEFSRVHFTSFPGRILYDPPQVCAVYAPDSIFNSPVHKFDPLYAQTNQFLSSIHKNLSFLCTGAPPHHSCAESSAQETINSPFVHKSLLFYAQMSYAIHLIPKPHKKEPPIWEALF